MACRDPRCGCAFVSNTLTISEVSPGVWQFEQAEFSVITDLQNDVAQLKTDMTNAEATLSTHGADISLLETDVDALEASYETTDITAGAGMTASGRLIRIPTKTGFSIIHAFNMAFVNSTGGALANGQTICTIPTGFRPTSARRCVGWNTSTGQNNINCIVQPTGLVQIGIGGGWVAPTNGQTFSFSGVSWESTQAAP